MFSSDENTFKKLIREACLNANEYSKSKGFWNKENPENPENVSIAVKLALIHSEVSEALEEYRVGNMEAYLDMFGKPQGFPTEMADIALRLFDLCGYLGIDLGSQIIAKFQFNASRPLMHGNKKI